MVKDDRVLMDGRIKRDISFYGHFIDDSSNLSVLFLKLAITITYVIRVPTN